MTIKSATIKLTKKQKETLAPFVDVINQASEEGKPGAVLGIISDDMGKAIFRFLPNEVTTAVNEVLVKYLKSEKEEL